MVEKHQVPYLLACIKGVYGEARGTEPGKGGWRGLWGKS